MPDPRFFIIEFGCCDRVGHRCNGLEALVRALTNKGFEAVSGVNEAASNEILKACNGTQITQLKPWPPFSKDAICGPLETFLEHGSTGAQNLVAFLEETNSDDFVLLYTASENEIFALARWYSTRSAERRPRLIANVTLPQFFDYETGAPNLRGRLLRTAIREMNRYALPGRRLYTTLTQRLAQTLKTITGVNYLIVKNPIDLSEFTRDRASLHRKGPVLIAAPGQPKGSKGADVLPLIAQAVTNSDCRIIAQNWPSDETLPGNVDILPTNLSRSEYLKYVLGCDITVLPYEKHFYSYGVSAVFEEAVSAGHVIVTTSETWMAEAIDTSQAIGSHAPEGDVEELARQVAEASRNIDILRTRAAEVGENWRKKRGIEAYVEEICAAFDLA